MTLPATPRPRVTVLLALYGGGPFLAAQLDSIAAQTGVDWRLIAGDDAGRMTAVIQPAQCSDGMSDRVYGLSAVLVFDGAGQRSQMLSGCCRITP